MILLDAERRGIYHSRAIRPRAHGREGNGNPDWIPDPNFAKLRWAKQVGDDNCSTQSVGELNPKRD